jgi:DNA-binding transcriptional LysR family regulator
MSLADHLDNRPLFGFTVHMTGQSTQRGDLNAVAVFASVLQHRSFRGAGRALGMPKSTVSAKVAELEAELGARLLERTTRSLRLTDAGRAYYERVTPALEALAGAALAVEELSAAPSGRLRVTTTVEGGQILMGPLVAEYVTRYPNVEVDVHLADRHVDLIEEGFDLALRGGPLPDSTLVARKLAAPGRLRVYASPAYLAKRGVPRRPKDLERHDCLVMTAQSKPLSWGFRVRRRSVTVEVRARSQANSFVVLRDLALAGIGVARLPDYIGGPASDEGKLRPLLEAFLPPPLPFHAVYPSSRHLSPKVRAMVELLEQRFGVDGTPGNTRGPALVPSLRR